MVNVEGREELWVSDDWSHERAENKHVEQVEDGHSPSVLQFPVTKFMSHNRQYLVGMILMILHELLCQLN